MRFYLSSSWWILFLFPIITVLSYQGPATSEYFREHFNTSKPMQTLECNAIETRATTANEPVIYYNLSITAEMKKTNGLIFVTTCCPSCLYNTSLDTVLYLLSSRKQQADLLQYSDDISSEQITTSYISCDSSDTQKSYIDLMEYEAGEYIVAVGGYGYNFGAFVVKVLCLDQTATYYGPANEAWFQEQFDTFFTSDSDIAKFDDISCGSTINASTESNYLVHYYSLNITEEMQKTYDLEISLSTCCRLNICDPYAGSYASNNVSSDERILSEFAIYLKTDYAYSEANCIQNELTSDIYQEFCDDFDSVLYVLQHSKQGIELIKRNDDMSYSTRDCSLKSYIDLNTLELEVGEYLIAVGGYSQLNGSYFLDMRCRPYSFPLIIEEFDPPSSVDKIKCGQAIDGTITEKEMVAYYELNIYKNTYAPIKISTCINATTDDFRPVVYLFDNPSADVYSMPFTGEHSYKACDSSYDNDTSVYDYSDISDVDYNALSRAQSLNYRELVIHSWETEDIGSYIIAVQGWLNKAGNFSLSVTCPPPTSKPTQAPTKQPTSSPTYPYTFPLEKYQLNVVDNDIVTINCGALEAGENTYENLVSYFAFNITAETHKRRPVTINTCPQKHHKDYGQLDAHIYIAKQYESGMVIYASSDFASCDGLSAEIDVGHLQKGEYYAIIQGSENYKIGNFSILMKCEDLPFELNEAQLKAAVFGTFALLFLLFVIWYIYIWRLHCMRNKQCCYSQTAPHLRHDDKRESVPDEFEERHVLFATDDDPDHKVTLNDKHEEYEAGEARRIDGDKEFIQQLAKNEDVVQRVISHALQCCEDQQGMDVYQVLAIRYHDKQSQEIKGTKPFNRIGINLEIVQISPFMQTLFVALIIAFAQSVGTSIVVWKLIYPFFVDGITDDTCSMEAEHWTEVYSLKLLAFLFSLIITLHISITLNNLEHAGLYEMMAQLTVGHMVRVDAIVLWILQIGQAINYYACLLAVVGSYFIIFQSKEGEEQDDGTIDYSSAALDMILNAVALFFLLELDNVMVSAQDYVDCEEHLQHILDIYYADLNINNVYKQDGDNANVIMCTCCKPEAVEKKETVEISGFGDYIREMDKLPFMQWSSDGVIEWILSLDNGRYKAYRKKLNKSFKTRAINGACLPDIKRFDLLSCGILNFKDGTDLMKEIQQLAEENNNVSDGLSLLNPDALCPEQSSAGNLFTTSATDVRTYTERTRDLCLDDYAQWKNQDVVDWILSLNRSYLRYRRRKMIKNAIQNEITGSSLAVMTREDLKSLGITDDDARDAIYQQIRLEFKNENNCCLKYVVPFLHGSISMFSVLVKVCCYGGGFIAPFLIFFCW